MKGWKRFLSIGLVFTMLIGQLILGTTSTYALEKDNDDYSDTTEQNNIDKLNIDIKDVGNLKEFAESPLYDVENNELLLPRLEGYKVEIFGSDNKATISLKGEVTRPLETQTVKLLYKLTNKENNEVTTTETNATIKVPAKETNISGKNKKPQVIPGLREWVAGNGKVDLTDARIVLGSQAFSKAARTFQEDYRELTGRNITLVTGNESDVKAGDIFLQEDISETMLGDEGYYLYIGGEEADQNYVTVKATHNTGALYGTISLLQILKQDNGRNELPRGLVKDYPLFEQRGMMLDVARKWFPMEYLEDLSKQMSWYKLNMLSLHLSDNDIWNGLSTENGLGGQPEGWFRLESELYPGLTSTDHYTKKQFRDYQYDCMELGIDVIPELDTPGHALAYTNLWPELKFPGNVKYLDAGNPETLKRVTALFDEYINGYNGGEATFVGDYVNIGTDEYKAGTGSAKESFRKYCNDLLEYINSTGKEAVFWGSLKENSGSTPVTTDATMFAWFQGYADAKQSLDAGYKIISMEDSETYIVPGGGYYSNQFGRAEYLYNSWLPNNNYGWANHPAPVGHPGVSGGQFAVWNDFSGNGISVNDVSYRIQHNLYTVAEKCWAGHQKKNEGYNYASEKKLASVLGDAPNTDFLYEIDKNIKDNELIKLDDKTNNLVEGVNILEATNITEDVKGKDGKAIQFNGGSSYFKTDIESAGFGWTTAMWIQPVDTASGTLMEGQTGKLYLDNGKIRYDVEGYTHTFNCDIKEGEWTHITLIESYEGVKLYINGTLFDSLINKPFPNWNNNSGCNSWNGSYPTNDLGQRTQRYYETLMLPLNTIGGKENAVKAIVDDFQVYNTILDENAIKKLAGSIIYENLALNQTATASANETDSLNPTKAVDGVTSGTSRWASNYNDDACFMVDLGSKQNVNKIKIFWEASYAVKYKLLVSSDNINWTEVYNEENGNGGISDIDFEMKSDIQYVKFQGVQRATEYGYSFYEMEVYGDKVAGEDDYERANVALNKEVTVGNYHSASQEADRSGKNAVDGSKVSRWEFDINNPAENYITIPLNSDEDVNKVIISQYEWGANRISKIKIAIIDDADKETVCYNETVYPESTTIMRDTVDEVFELSQVVKGKAIKIYLTPKAAGADDLVNIAEVELYGTKAAETIDPDVPTEDTTERNQTLIPHSTMTATATSEHPNVGSEGLASMAIDDNLNTWWHTNWSNVVPLPQSITIDLHDIKLIGNYTYLPRPDAGNGTISQYKLEISLDGTHYEQVAAGKWELNADLKTVNFAPRAARYIRLTAIEGKGGFASAREINIYQTDAILKTDLEKIVDDAKKIDLSGYMISSTEQFKNALQEAETLLGQDSPTEEQMTVASIELQNGLDALDVATNNLSDLETLYNEKKDIANDDYTQDSYQQLTDVLNSAKALLDREGDVGEKEKHAAIQALNDASDNLISLVELKKSIVLAEKVDITDVTQLTGDELILRLNAAKSLVENASATQNQIDIATYRLSIAIDDLQADNTALQTLITSLDHENVYTSSSWTTFAPVLTTAKEKLSTTTIQELTEARLALLEAQKGLALRATAENIAALQTFVDNSASLNAEDYTQESWNGYMALINEIKELLKAPDILAQTDALAKITEANQFQLVHVDVKKQLQDMIDEYKDLNQMDYISSSWMQFAPVLSEANDYLADDKTYDEVKNMISRLSEAYSKLVMSGEKALREYMQTITLKQPDNYTEESYALYKGAYTNLGLLLQDAANVSLEDFNIAKDNYEKYLGLLEYKPADYSKVDDLLLTVPKDLSNYEKETVDALNTAINNIVRGKNITEQAIVDEYAIHLKKAIDGLKEKPDLPPEVVDKLELSQLIVKANTYVKDDKYTEDTLNYLMKEIKKAQAVVDKKDATQAEVDTAIANLNHAIKGLKTKPVIPPKQDEYVMTEGNHFTFKPGEDVKFVSKAPIEKFKEVLLDGNVLARQYYTVKSGSTIVTLNPEFTKTLSAGKHTLIIVSTDGKATAEFNIDKGTTSEDIKNPATSDSTQTIGWMGLISLSVIGIILVNLKKKREHISSSK